MSSTGHPLKLEDSWASSSFSTYGKVPIYQGVPLPMSLKKVFRMHRLNNDGVINLDGALSSISANASAAVAMCNYQITQLFLAVKGVHGSVVIVYCIALSLQNSFYGILYWTL